MEGPLLHSPAAWLFRSLLHTAPYYPDYVCQPSRACRDRPACTSDLRASLVTERPTHTSKRTVRRQGPKDAVYRLIEFVLGKDYRWLLADLSLQALSQVPSRYAKSGHRGALS